MAWLKSSDTAANHPIVLAPLVWPVDDHGGLQPLETVDLLFGLVNRCAVYSAQYTTDYAIADSVIAQMIGPRWLHWATLAARAGYWERVEGGWTLVDDAEHLFHIRRRAEIDWEKARKIDVANPALVVPVRLRDGDGCRYCGHVVQWTARRGNRAGTYDHRAAGQPAHHPDDLVVACGLCNRLRSNNHDPEAWPLRLAPANPYYGPESARFLAGYGHHVQQSDPASSGTTPGDPASSGTTPARQERAPAQWAPGVTEQALPGPADLQISADPADRGYPAVRNPGRVGDGSGRRRSRRGRRTDHD